MTDCTCIYANTPFVPQGEADLIMCNIRTSLLAKTIAFVQNVVQAQLKIHLDSKVDILDDLRLIGCALLLVTGMPKSGLGDDLQLTDSESPSQAYELKQAVYGVRKRFRLLEVLFLSHFLPVSLISAHSTCLHSHYNTRTRWLTNRIACASRVRSVQVAFLHSGLQSRRARPFFHRSVSYTPA